MEENTNTENTKKKLKTKLSDVQSEKAMPTEDNILNNKSQSDDNNISSSSANSVKKRKPVDRDAYRRIKRFDGTIYL